MHGARGIDSLKIVLSETSIDSTTDRQVLLKAIAVEYLYTNLDSAEVYGKRLLYECQSDGDLLPIAKACNSLADIYNLRGEYKKALDMMQQSLEVCTKLGSLKGLTVNNFLKGNILQNLHQYEAADSAYQKSMQLAISNADSAMVANNYLNIGINYELQGDDEKAFKYYFSAAEYFEKQGNKRGLSQAYSNLIGVFNSLGQIEKSIEYAEKAIALKKEIGSYGILPTSYQNLSIAYASNKEYTKSLSLIDSAFHYARLAKVNHVMPFLHYTKAEQLSKLNKQALALSENRKGLDLAQQLQDSFQIVHGYRSVGRILFRQKKYAAAEPYLRNAVTYACSINNSKMELGSLESLFDNFAALGKYEEATSLHQRIRIVRDSFFSEQKILAINELEAKYQTEKAATLNRLLVVEKEAQALTIRRQRSRLWLFALAAAALGIIAFITYRRSRERKLLNDQLRAQNERIVLLHQELNHRVKNNLAFIAGLMRMQRRHLSGAEARQAVREGESRIEAMSLLHRKFYMEGRDNATELHDYLDELCGYLLSTYPLLENIPDIQLDIIPLTTNDEAASCIGLIVNELVTNSFKHAFDKQKDPIINIRMERKGANGYRLTYADNGIGIPLSLNINKIDSLGMKLINILTRQLDGTLTLEREPTARFYFDFIEDRIVA